MDSNSLSTVELRVVEVLLEDWRDVSRCTAVNQAMERVGLPFSHFSRLRISEFLMGDATAAGLMRWAPSTYVLSNEEKLIARRLIRLWRKRTPITQPRDDQWRQSGRSAEQIEDAFQALAWLRFLRQSGGQYEVAEDVESFLRGVGFYFHEVVLPERGERFNTNCAPDFFFLTNRAVRERSLGWVSEATRSASAEAMSEQRLAAMGMSEKMLAAIRGVDPSGVRALQDSAFYGDEKAILNDACGRSDDPIRVVMDRGQLVEITPDTTWYLLGGG